MAKRGVERKDMIILARLFSEEIDGKFDYEIEPNWKGIYGRRYDRTYLKYRLEDEVFQRSKNNSCIVRKRETGIKGIYIVLTTVKIGTKKEQALIDMGFTEIKGAV